MTTDTPSLPEGNIEGTVKAVTDLVKAVPIYDDAIQPVAKETGKALQTVGRAVNAALLPVRGLVWGVEKIEEFVHSRVSKKLEGIPAENICTPDPAVAGPALESLRYTGHKESLSELYANLLASAMDISTAKTAHPSFVEIIRNMASDEAKLMNFILGKQVFPVIDLKKVLIENGGEQIIHELISTIGHDAGCEHKELTASYLNNLERLGLIAIPRDSYLTDPTAYDRILNEPVVKFELQKLNDGGEKHKGDVNKYYVKPTVFGKQFGAACVVSRDKT
ncbi:MAG: DUF4393 domain-containing protein [Nitrososphaerales archaeon]